MIAFTEEKHGGSMSTQVEHLVRHQRRCMKKRHSYLSGLQTDFDYLNAPVKPDDEVLKDQVQRYRDGDTSLRAPIIEAHLHIVASIVGDYRRNDTDEILGVALLELVDAVHRAPDVLEDNAITPYITSCVRYRIKDAIGRDRSIFMPPRTFNRKSADGEVDVVKVVFSIGDDYYGDDEWTRQLCNTPTARPEEPSVEFREVLSMSIKTPMEERIVSMAAEGHNFETIEGVLQMKKTQIGYHLNNVMNRFDRLYA